MNKQQYYVKHQVPEKVMERYWSALTPGKVLDLGCGAGDLGKYNRTKSKVYGLDIDENAIKIASKYEIARKFNIKKKLPFKDEYFDSVLAKDILEHLQKPWEVVKEINRVLKKGGIAVASVPSPSRWAWEDYTHVRPFTDVAISNLFEDYGFEVIKKYRIGSIPMFGKMNIEHLINPVLRIWPFGYLFGKGWEIIVKK